MPVTARGVTVRGGRKLARFLRRATDPNVTETARARAIANVLRNMLVPALRSVLPKRTGFIRRSLRVEQRGVNVSIKIAFYWRFLLIGPSRQRPDEWAVDWINANKSVIRTAISVELRKALLGGIV